MIAFVGSSRWTKTAGWLFESFGPLLIFVAVEHTWGLLAAIISGIACGVLIVAMQIVRDRKLSPFTAFIAVNVAVFGALDLHYQSGFFVKLEPAFGNLATALFFIGTVVIKKPIVLEFARRQKPDIPDSAIPFLSKMTIAWGIFFLLRAAGHVWLAYNVSLDQALVLRGLIGPASFGAMFAAQFVAIWVYRRRRESRAKLALSEIAAPDTTTSP